MKESRCSRVFDGMSRIGWLGRTQETWSCSEGCCREFQEAELSGWRQIREVLMNEVVMVKVCRVLPPSETTPSGMLGHMRVALSLHTYFRALAAVSGRSAQLQYVRPLVLLRNLTYCSSSTPTHNCAIHV